MKLYTFEVVSAVSVEADSEAKAREIVQDGYYDMQILEGCEVGKLIAVV